MPDTWLSVWSALGDGALEKRLRYYLWLSTVVPGSQQRRVEQLIAEAQRRGKPEIVDNARKWLEQSKVAPLL